MPIPNAIAEAGGPQPSPVSLRIVDVPGGIMLEVATPQFIVYPFLSQYLIQWLEEQLRLRSSRVLAATDADVVDVLKTKKGS